MLINNTFEVAEPLEKVWDFFGNVPQVAACLPGAELTDDLGEDLRLTLESAVAECPTQALSLVEQSAEA